MWQGGQGGAEWLEVSGGLEMKDVTRGDCVDSGPTFHRTDQKLSNLQSPPSSLSPSWRTGTWDPQQNVFPGAEGALVYLLPEHLPKGLRAEERWTRI